MRKFGFLALALAPFFACGGGGDDNNGHPDGSTDGGNIDETMLPMGDGPVNMDSGLGACATDTQKAQLLPLDLYIMQDTSGSMWTQIAQNTSKYSAVQKALTQFVMDPGSNGLGVGLQFFPVNKAGEPASCMASNQCTGGGMDFCLLNMCIGLNPKSQITPCNTKSDCGPGENCYAIGTCANDPNTLCLPNTQCGNDPNGFALGACSAKLSTSTCTLADSCTAADYAKPAVPIAVLPGAAATLVSTLNAKKPNGNTPTSAALQGAVDQAKQYAMANPTHTVVVVFSTDGLPTECDTNFSNITTIAKNAANGSPSIKTFVIGVFAQNEQAMAKPNLDNIAMAGGTNQAFIVTTNSNTAMQFLQAMNQIRTQSLPCEFFLPKPDGGIPDYNKVNVQLTSSNMNITVIPYVGSATACDPMKGGWYYDIDPTEGGVPTKVELCPVSCGSVKADVGAKIDIVQGCKTQTIGIN